MMDSPKEHRTNGINAKLERVEWQQKAMRLKNDTFAIYQSVKKNERYTDNEMVEFLLAGLLYLKSNRAKFSGFNKGMPREAVFKELLKYYDGNPGPSRMMM